LLIPRVPGEPPVPGEPKVPQEPPVPVQLLDFIRNGKKFLIAGHKEPDGDCVGSQIALASVLRRMGKEAVLCSAGPFKRVEIEKYEELFSCAPDVDGSENVIIVDCSSPDRTGDLEIRLGGLPTAIIDHHEVNQHQPFGEYAAYYVDAHAPATTYMIMKLVSVLGLELTGEEAEILFFGLSTDTGFFRHVDETGARTFEAAADLIHKGANPKLCFRAIYGGKSLDSRRLMGHVLVKAESFFDGKLVVSSEEYEETSRFGLEGRDSDALYQLLQSVAGVEAIVLIRQETPEKCTVGLRSLSWVDVRVIAESFGGGGHKNAAGFALEATISELKQKILKSFENVF